MDTWLKNPTFVIYAITSLVLTLNVLFLWGYSGAVRAKTKSAMNPEDAKLQGARLVEADPPEVARVLRAHSNAQATIYPFLLVGTVFVLAGGGAGMAQIVFGGFVATRILHSIIYLAGKQPWRTILFILSGVFLIVLIGDTAWLLAQGPVPH